VNDALNCARDDDNAPLPQVLISVAPRLLTDLLVTDFRERSAEGVIDLEGGVTISGSHRRWDPALTSGLLPDHLAADGLIVLADTGDGVLCVPPRGHQLELPAGSEAEFLADLVGQLGEPRE
jgi:hypothetical protein